MPLLLIGDALHDPDEELRHLCRSSRSSQRGIELRQERDRNELGGFELSAFAEEGERALLADLSSAHSLKRASERFSAAGIGITGPCIPGIKPRSFLIRGGSSGVLSPDDGHSMSSAASLSASSGNVYS